MQRVHEQLECRLRHDIIPSFLATRSDDLLSALLHLHDSTQRLAQERQVLYPDSSRASVLLDIPGAIQALLPNDITVELESLFGNFLSKGQSPHFYTMLVDLGLEEQAEEAFSSNILKQIRRDLEEASLQDLEHDGASIPVLEASLSWISVVLRPWLSSFLANPDPWLQLFSFFARETFLKIRSLQLFDLLCKGADDLSVIHPALLEIGEAVSANRCEHMIGPALACSFRQRLLHPAASTDQILTLYILTIESFQIMTRDFEAMLDSSTVELRTYLRSRPDTLENIVRRVFMEDGDPDFIDLQYSGLGGGKPDVLGILLELYPSVDMFILEFKKALAKRLLASPGFDVDAELARVEHLKKRVGESNATLAICEAMMHDISSSSRCQIASSIFSSKVLSKEIWPVGATSIVHLPNLPPSIGEALAQFSKTYEAVHVPRELVWLHSMGRVTLEIDEALWECTPMEAAVLLLLDEGHCNLESLCAELHCSASLISPVLEFWKGSHIITETKNRLVLSDSIPKDPGVRSRIQNTRSTSSSDQVSLKATLRSKILGFLPSFRNSGLRLSEIHNMLLLLSEQGKTSTEETYYFSIEELHVFLLELIEQGHLRESHGLFTRK